MMSELPPLSDEKIAQVHPIYDFYIRTLVQ